jgi:hypothetical protein
VGVDDTSRLALECRPLATGIPRRLLTPESHPR